MTTQLTITEIYRSIQGESSFAGLPCVFVRMTGCPLRCRWCDTAYAFSGGKTCEVQDIVREVRSYETPLVELTGGEPLAQKAVPRLAEELLANDLNVLIETGGSEDIGVLPPKTHVIMDLKCPESGMMERNLWSNLQVLKKTDEIKFVVANRRDFEWAAERIQQLDLDHRFQLLFSPAFGLLPPKELAEWLLESRINARMQLQLHKHIWHPRKKGV